MMTLVRGGACPDLGSLWLPLWLFCCALAAACSGPALDTTRAAVTRDTVAGVEVVAGDSVDRPLPWTLRELWRLGDVDGPDALYDVPPHGLAIAGDRLFVLDRGNHRVLRVDLASGYIVASRPFRTPSDSVTLSLVRWATGDTAEVFEARGAGERYIKIGGCPTELGWDARPIGALELAWFAASWGVVVNGTAGYSIEVLAPSRRRIVRPLAAQPFTDADARDYLDRNRLPTLNGCRLDDDDFLRKMGHVDAHQRIQALALSPAGELWARRLGPIQARDSVIDIFDADGAYLGSLPGDRPFPEAFAPDGSFATIESDSLGVQSVVAYRVEPHHP